jgi:hypothetical protein
MELKGGFSTDFCYDKARELKFAELEVYVHKKTR